MPCNEKRADSFVPVNRRSKATLARAKHKNSKINSIKHDNCYALKVVLLACNTLFTNTADRIFSCAWSQISVLVANPSSILRPKSYPMKDNNGCIEVSVSRPDSFARSFLLRLVFGKFRVYASPGLSYIR